VEWERNGLTWRSFLSFRYTKPKGVNPDYDDPVILSADHTTVEDFCNRIHKDMLKQFKWWVA
jgi:ribosome-interacting GTPase 1